MKGKWVANRLVAFGCALGILTLVMSASTGFSRSALALPIHLRGASSGDAPTQATRFLEVTSQPYLAQDATTVKGGEVDLQPLNKSTLKDSDKNHPLTIRIPDGDGPWVTDMVVSSNGKSMALISGSQYDSRVDPSYDEPVITCNLETETKTISVVSLDTGAVKARFDTPTDYFQLAGMSSDSTRLYGYGPNVCRFDQTDRVRWYVLDATNGRIVASFDRDAPLAPPVVDPCVTACTSSFLTKMLAPTRRGIRRSWPTTSTTAGRWAGCR